LSSSLLGALAQRLVRVLCDDCKRADDPIEHERQMLGLKPDQPAKLYRPVGCERCNHQGYRGRTGIYELVIIDDPMRELIHERAGELKLTRLARSRKPSIREDGLRKVMAGETCNIEV